MRLLQQLLEAEHLVTRLNCSSCMFSKGQRHKVVEADELNDQGGIDSTDEGDIARAKDARLITLPGKTTTDIKVWCANPKVDRWITDRMWCTHWDTPDTIHVLKKNK